MHKLAPAHVSALAGIQRDMESLHRATAEIAHAAAEGRDPTQLADPLVRALVAERAIEAAAEVLKRSDEAIDDVLESLRA